MTDTPMIPLRGDTYPVVGPSEFDLGELCDCEMYFGATFDDDSLNARKLAAVLYVSMHRKDSRIDAQVIRSVTSDELEEVRTALEKYVKAGDAGPPDPSGSNGSSPPFSTDDSPPPSDDLSEPDPSSTGDPTSDTGSVSDPVTSES